MSTQYENLSFFPPGTNASTQSTLDGFTVHPGSRPKVVSLIKHEEPALAFIARRRNWRRTRGRKKNCKFSGLTETLKRSWVKKKYCTWFQNIKCFQCLSNLYPHCQKGTHTQKSQKKAKRWAGKIPRLKANWGIRLPPHLTLRKIKTDRWSKKASENLVVESVFFTLTRIVVPLFTKSFKTI